VEREGNLGGWLVLALLVAALIVVGAIALATVGDDEGPELRPPTTTAETQTETATETETETEPETETETNRGDTGETNTAASS
jgi:multidrug efflux pump subunit AcrB